MHNQIKFAQSQFVTKKGIEKLENFCVAGGAVGSRSALHKRSEASQRPAARQAVVATLALAALLALPQSAGADTLTSSGNWDVTSNWTTGVPASGDDAYVDSNLLVLAPAGVSATAANLYVGNSGTGTLNITGGTLTSNVGFFGYNAGSNGTVTISSGIWTNSSDLFIAMGGTGTLNVNGGIVTNNNGYLGVNAGSNGTATVVGSLNGSGLVVPGNGVTPGIMTATTVSAGSGLSFAFELTGATPSYGSPTASLNDVLHLTGGALPVLGSTNTISIYFSSLSNSYEGGLFVDNLTASALLSDVANASFSYYVLDTGGNTTGDTYFNGAYYSILPSTDVAYNAVYQNNAAFKTGTKSGSTLDFLITIPEPNTWAIIAAGAGLLAFSQKLRRRLG